MELRSLWPYPLGMSWTGRGREQCFSVSSPAVVGPVEWTGLCFSYMEKTLAWMLLGHKPSVLKTELIGSEVLCSFPRLSGCSHVPTPVHP